VLDRQYLTLTPDWLKTNPTFELNIPLKPRFVAPHPYTNQDVVALARGPLIYCVEDFDNPWVDDHFKSLLINPSGEITENIISDSELGGSCITLTAHNAASFLTVRDYLGPHIPVVKVPVKETSGVEHLNFIPYYLRDNRGGRGHMRVGIRRKH
jgi:DUF1680 family protein